MNQNTIQGLYNIPAQSITTGTETALLVPAAGLYPGFPSPLQAAGTGLQLCWPADIQGADGIDGHPFKVRVVGKAFTGGSYTFQTKLYQVPYSIVTAGTSATLANDNVALSNAASAAFTGWANFILEAQFLWDSSSQKLNTSFQTSLNQVNGAAVAPTSSIVSIAYTAGNPVNNLNFLPSFTFGTANAANSVTVTEFTLERL